MNVVLRGFWFLVVVCSVCFAYATPLQAATQTQSGTVTLNGIVPGPPPAAPPTITMPIQGAELHTKNIEVKGDCTSGLVVKVFRSGLFVGSAVCQTSNTYELLIDLADGRNDLIARQYDSLNQPSPDSDTITVYFSTPAAIPQPGSDSVGSATATFQLTVNYDYTVQNVFAGQPVRIPVRFTGGAAPYAISIDWGDGQTTLVSRESSGLFISEHTYTSAGLYSVIIKISDKNGQQAYEQFVILVNGKIDTSFVGRLFGSPNDIANGSMTALVIASITLFVGFVCGLAAVRFLPWLATLLRKH